MQITRPNKGSFSRAFIFLALIFSVFPAFGSEMMPGKSAIATAHPLATAAGFEILEQGGNAFDAAVAVSAALAVVEPAGSGIGGGGFWLLHQADNNRQIMVDGREKAPMAASRDMYLDDQGEPVPGLSTDGPLSAGIPGIPAALVHLTENYASLPLSVLLAPAIRYAEEGFEVGARYRKMVAFRLKALLASEAAAKVYLDRGKVILPGFKLVQKDLAETLRRIAADGRDGFYAGDTAETLVQGVRDGGGIWTLEDLKRYRVVERQPIRFDYRGIQVTSAPPPSSGGLVLAEALNILSAYPLETFSEADRMHLVIEAMRRAYHDRARYLGDPDFVEMPVERMLSTDYAAGRRGSIRLDKATPSGQLSEAVDANSDGEDTTHFSILDNEGNRVAATLSINYPFGSGFMVEGTGVVLNNEMDDFSKKPGEPNGYGLIGGKANAIEPGKRMLSSMSPTFLDDGERVAILGTPGGSRIISMVLLATLDYARGNGPESWVSLPRYHHQYVPDLVQFEKEGLSRSLQDLLKHKGHSFKEISRRYGDMQAIEWDRKNGTIQAASDPRGEGEVFVK